MGLLFGSVLLKEEREIGKKRRVYEFEYLVVFINFFIMFFYWCYCYLCENDWDIICCRGDNLERYLFYNSEV